MADTSASASGNSPVRTDFRVVCLSMRISFERQLARAPGSPSRAIAEKTLKCDGLGGLDYEAPELRIGAQRLEIGIVEDVAPLAETQGLALRQLPQGHAPPAAQRIESRGLNEVRGVVVGKARRLGDRAPQPG